MRKAFLILLLLLFAAQANAATYWVRGDGILGGCLASATAPATSAGYMSTIAAGIACTNAGDTLYIRGGTYNERINSNDVAMASGTSYSNAPVFAGYNNETVIIKPTASGGGILNIATSAASPNLKYQIWQDLIFDGGSGVTTGQGVTNGESNIAIGFGNEGVSGPDAHHIRMIRVTSRNNQSGNPKIVSNVGNGFQLGDGGNNELLQCVAHTNGNFTDAEGKAGYGVYLGGSENIIDGCEIYNNGGYGIHQFGSGATTFNKNVIKNNRLRDNSTHSTQFTAGIILSSGTGNVAVNNRIKGGQAGIQVASTCTSCLVYSNTIYGQVEAGLYPEGKGTFINNVVQNSVTAVLDGGFPGSPTFTTNACFGNTTSTNCNFTSLDPRFVDAPNLDFRLCTAAGVPHSNCTAASGLIDVGTTLGSPYNVDIVGSVRPQGAAYDIGAYESGVVVPPSNALVAQYSCDNVVTDSSGNANHGTLTSGATYNASGKYSQACSFDGINDSVTIADANSLDNPTGFTLMAWVYPTSVANDSVIINKNPDTKYAIFASIDGRCGENAVAAAYSEGDNNALACDSTPLTLNTWTHLAATYDRTSVKLYKNGVLRTSAAGSAFLSASSGTLQLGASSFGEYFTGLIDEVWVYNHARTLAQINADMFDPITEGGAAPSVAHRLGTGTLKLGGAATIRLGQ